MLTMTTVVLAILIFLSSALYSSVGHAGASGDLAAMALVGIAPEVMRPTALVLNIFVASIATFKFYRAKCFVWGLFWPFAIASVPFAFLGGSITVPGRAYKIMVGVLLLYAAFRLFRASQKKAAPPVRAGGPPLWAALLCGAAIGILSGLTGTGGGIFLSPLLLLMGWAEMRQTAGVSAAFILANSTAGLAGNLSSVHTFPTLIYYLLPAAIIGGYVGSEYGSRRLDPSNLRRLLALVLVIAGLKLTLTR
jgi:uncharacterized membrane protein YfcA